jgi:hypothetical protein
VSVWQSRDELERFAAANPHATIIRTKPERMAQSKFVFWTCVGREVPIGWHAVAEHLDVPGADGLADRDVEAPESLGETFEPMLEVLTRQDLARCTVRRRVWGCRLFDRARRQVAGRRSDRAGRSGRGSRSPWLDQHQRGVMAPACRQHGDARGHLDRGRQRRQHPLVRPGDPGTPSGPPRLPRHGAPATGPRQARWSLSPSLTRSAVDVHTGEKRARGSVLTMGGTQWAEPGRSAHSDRAYLHRPSEPSSPTVTSSPTSYLIRVQVSSRSQIPLIRPSVMRMNETSSTSIARPVAARPCHPADSHLDRGHQCRQHPLVRGPRSRAQREPSNLGRHGAPAGAGLIRARVGFPSDGQIRSRRCLIGSGRVPEPRTR